jgi:hypothetical protein
MFGRSRGWGSLFIRGALFAATVSLVTHTAGHEPKASSTAVDLLPDLVAVQWALYENQETTSIQPGRTHLKLSQLTANIGDGKLYFWGGPDNGDGTQDVFQRVFRDDATWYDLQAGVFVFHPAHGHVHFEGWAIYRIREILPGDGVGPILASGQKTSFCVFDNTLHDPNLPGFNPAREFTFCGTTVQGLGVGWGDTYDLNTEGQNIDITDVPAGEYWLEAEVDPDGTILELDESNNIARVKVTLGQPSSINPDPYEPNESTADLVGRPVGGFNSPILGPCGPFAQIQNLTVHVASIDEEDYYKFYMPAQGAVSDYLRIDFNHGEGDLRLRLYNDSEVEIEYSNSSSSSENFEQVALDGHGPGWFYFRVDSQPGQDNPNYQITIDPSANGTPSITVVNPPTGDVQVIQAIETYQVTWSASDPESNETWVNVYLNSAPVLDGNEELRFTSLNTPGSQGLYVLATVALPLGTYYVYCEVTDGGTVSGDWAEGTLTVIDEATAVGDTPASQSRLLPNVPNPFNPSTLLRVELMSPSHVEWKIYSIRGELVRTIESGPLTAGPHLRQWDGRDHNGNTVASGVYLNVVETAHFRSMQKLVLLK